MIWKPGDRAVVCYRPECEIIPLKWTPPDLLHVGLVGTVQSNTWQESQWPEISRVDFLADTGEQFSPAIKVLAPIIQDPFASIPKGELQHV